jgi:hypothetical protein
LNAGTGSVGLAWSVRVGWSGDFTGLPSTSVSWTPTTLPATSTLTRNGPNSSPIQKPSATGWIDSTSKSAPVR